MLWAIWGGPRPPPSRPLDPPKRLLPAARAPAWNPPFSDSRRIWWKGRRFSQRSCVGAGKDPTPPLVKLFLSSCPVSSRAGPTTPPRFLQSEKCSLQFVCVYVLGERGGGGVSVSNFVPQAETPFFEGVPVGKRGYRTEGSAAGKAPRLLAIYSLFSRDRKLKKPSKPSLAGLLSSSIPSRGERCFKAWCAICTISERKLIFSHSLQSEKLSLCLWWVTFSWLSFLMGERERRSDW
jgi:hypothetical protein